MIFNILQAQIEADVGNWRIKNRGNNLAALLAIALLRLTVRGGAIGSCIQRIDEIYLGVDNTDVNDGVGI